MSQLYSRIFAISTYYSDETMEIYLAHTQGFCAGVSRAMEVVERALTKYGTPLYVFHEIVHNTAVVNDFKKRGVTFVEDLEAIPDRSRVIFSAHGVSPSVIKRAQEKKLQYIDATCPLVTKVHTEALSFSTKGIETVLIGHRNHQEIIGTLGYVLTPLLHIVENEEDIDRLTIDPAKPVGYLTQTTLSVTDTAKLIERLRSKFPKLINPPKEDICYATQNRQDAVRDLAKLCDMIVICGSPNSSNSNRLRETAKSEGIPSYIVDAAQDFDITLLEGKNSVGISSGASVPRYIVDDLISKIKKIYRDAKIHSFPSLERSIVFPIPKI